MQKLALTFLICLLSACVSAPHLEETMDHYRGQSEQAVVDKFGQPIRTHNEDGLKVLTYGERGLFKYPDCRASFFVNPQGSVERWNWSGRHCQKFTQETPGFSNSAQPDVK